MDCKDRVKQLSGYYGISGHEEELALFVKEIFNKYCDEVQIDKFFNVIGIKKGYGENKKKIMVSAHYDEIGLIVTSIDDRGFIKFSNIGGVDTKVLPAQEVIIHGKEDIYGIIGAKPPHLIKPEEASKSIKMQDMCIDVGMSRDEVKKHISIGDVITFKAEAFELLNNKISAKTMDNRSGAAALVETLKELHNIKHYHDIYISATVQEEVGLRGATTATYNINPDLVIVIDACHGDLNDAPKEGTFKLGKGVAIGIGPNLHKNLTKKIIEYSKEENFEYQIDVETGNTGTEAWATQISREGVPTILLSIPVRYMHTTVETLSINDVKSTGKLSARFISDLNNYNFEKMEVLK